MYSQGLLITAISYEAIKRDTITGLKASVDAIGAATMAVADWYDRKFPEPDYCTGDLLCGREGKRHKADCLGRTVPIGAYVKGLR